MWGAPWTRAEKDRAVELAATHTALQIAKLLDRPKAGVLRILALRGVDSVVDRWEVRAVWSYHDPHPPLTADQRRVQARLRMQRIRAERKYEDEQRLRRDARSAAD